MNYVVMYDLRVTGTGLDSIHDDYGAAETRARDVANILHENAFKKFGKDSSTKTERYLDSWAINEGEFATVYILSPEPIT